jgi:hypothetical protein
MHFYPIWEAASVDEWLYTSLDAATQVSGVKEQNEIPRCRVAGASLQQRQGGSRVISEAS